MIMLDDAHDQVLTAMETSGMLHRQSSESKYSARLTLMDLHYRCVRLIVVANTDVLAL